MQKKNKVAQDDTIEELIKGIHDLMIEMSEFKKSQKIISLKTIEGSKGFVERCMWCDSPDHKRGECDSYKAAIKENIVHFKEERIRLAGFDELLRTNFGKGGMKKLVEEQTSKGGIVYKKEAESYSITIEQSGVKTVSPPTMEAMIKAVETIRKMIGWNDLVDVISIKVFLSGNQHNDDLNNVMVEEKRGKVIHEEDIIKLPSKKKILKNIDVSKDQNLEKMCSFTHPNGVPLPKEW